MRQMRQQDFCPSLAHGETSWDLCELSTALCPFCDPPGTSCQSLTISLNSNLRFHLLLKRLNPVKVAPPAHHLTCQLPQVVPAIRLGGLPSFPYTLNDVDFELFRYYNDKVPIFNFKLPTIRLDFSPVFNPAPPICDKIRTQLIRNHWLLTYPSHVKDTNVLNFAISTGHTWYLSILVHRHQKSTLKVRNFATK